MTAAVRALDFLQQQQAPALRVARSHLSLGSFYLKTLDLGQGELGSSPASSRAHKSRFEAAENQLRKCMHICGSEVVKVLSCITLTSRAGGGRRSLVPPCCLLAFQTCSQEILQPQEPAGEVGAAVLSGSDRRSRR